MTEQELLHHLVFIYEYTFTQVDARPMPHGRTGACLRGEVGQGLTAECLERLALHTHGGGREMGNDGGQRGCARGGRTAWLGVPHVRACMRAWGLVHARPHNRSQDGCT